MDDNTVLLGTISVVVATLTLVELCTSAISELIAILLDAWIDADLRHRLGAWWYCCVTHRHLIDAPAPKRDRGR